MYFCFYPSYEHEILLILMETFDYRKTDQILNVKRLKISVQIIICALLNMVRGSVGNKWLLPQLETKTTDNLAA